MKLAELLTGYLAEGVGHVVERLAGKGSDTAAIIAEDDGVRHRVLVATQIGVIDCLLDTEGPVPARQVSHPLTTRLHRWDEWPLLAVTGDTYSWKRDEFSTTWTVTGWPEGVKIEHAAKREQEITEFVRACLEAQRPR